MNEVCRTVASQAGEVALDAPCRVCGKSEFDGQHGDMIFCDACDGAYHFRCLVPALTGIPEGLWTCPRWPRCQTKATKRSRGEPTYDYLRHQKVDKAALREQAGLGGLQFPTSALLEQVLEFRWAPRTKSAYDSAHRRYLDFCQEGALDERDLESLCLFVLRRLQLGASAATIQRDINGVRQKQTQWTGDERRLQLTLRAAARLADVPDQQRLPLSPDQLKRLRHAIDGWQSNSAYQEPIRWRDWAFFLLGFVGFFRGAELVALDWAHLHFVWEDRGREWRTTTPEPPAEAQDAAPRAVEVTVVQSKTSLTAQAVLVAAQARRSGLRVHECPFRMLRELWRRRPRSARAVFANPKTGSRLTTNTMLGRLKRYLAVVLKDQPGKESQYGLHSLRKGGATHAYRQGASMQEIKRQGRWRSDVAFLYTIVSDQEALAVSQNLLEDLQDAEE